MSGKMFALLALFFIPVCEHERNGKSWESVSLHTVYLLDKSKVTSAQELTGSQGCLVSCVCPILKQPNCKHLLSLLLLNDYFIPSENSWSIFLNRSDITKNTKNYRHTLRCVITLLLLLSGNVQPNPGPATTTMCLQTPADFLNRTGIGFIHMNVRSLLPKMDMVNIWANSTNADIMVVLETWLSRSIPDSHVNLDGYNIFRADRRAKGGGVAIYTNNTFQTTVISKSVPKQYELIVLKVEFTKGCVMTIVGCYRPPSASKDTLSSLTESLANVKHN